MSFGRMLFLQGEIFKLELATSREACQQFAYHKTIVKTSSGVDKLTHINVILLPKYKLLKIVKRRCELRMRNFQTVFH